MDYFKEINYFSIVTLGDHTLYFKDINRFSATSVQADELEFYGLEEYYNKRPNSKESFWLQIFLKGEDKFEILLTEKEIEQFKEDFRKWGVCSSKLLEDGKLSPLLEDSFNKSLEQMMETQTKNLGETFSANLEQITEKLVESTNKLNERFLESNLQLHKTIDTNIGKEINDVKQYTKTLSKVAQDVSSFLDTDFYSTKG